MGYMRRRSQQGGGTRVRRYVSIAMQYEDMCSSPRTAERLQSLSDASAFTIKAVCKTYSQGAPDL